MTSCEIENRVHAVHARPQLEANDDWEISAPSEIDRWLDQEFEYRKATNLRTQFGRLVERAGVIPWPKLFVNLRSTRRTELQERFPSHVVDSWLGHSSAVAAKHYLQVTDEHWERAAGFGAPISEPDVQKHGETDESGAPTGAPIDHDHGRSGTGTQTKKPRKNRGIDGGRWPTMVDTVPPQGLEPWTH